MCQLNTRKTHVVTFSMLPICEILFSGTFQSDVHVQCMILQSIHHINNAQNILSWVYQMLHVIYDYHQSNTQKQRETFRSHNAIGRFRLIMQLINLRAHTEEFMPHKVKTQYLHFRSHAEYFILSWKIPEVMSRRSILFHN